MSDPVSFVLPRRGAPDGYYVITRQQLTDALSVTSAPGTPVAAAARLADAILCELQGRRITQAESRPPRSVTVARLIGLLGMFSGELPVVALYDCRCAGGNVVAAEIGKGPDDGRESVVLVVE